MPLFKNINFYFFKMKGYLQEGKQKVNGGLMSCTLLNTKNISLKKNKPHLQNAFVADTPV